MDKRYGRLLVTDEETQIKKGNRNRLHIKCVCDCGNEVWIRKDSLTRGNTQSCGCMKEEQDEINLTVNHSHKLSQSKIWHTYYGMKSRCYNVEDKRYNQYGGRGIGMCGEWYDSFEAFAEWALDNKLEGHLQIDRIDNDGNYSPDNCRIVTAKRNSRNRSTNILVKHKNKWITIAEKADILNIPYKTAYSRYRKDGIKRSELNK